MERNRPWLGIIAVALAGLALVVALGGRLGPAGYPPAFAQMPQAPQAPFPGYQGRGEGFGHGRPERGAVPPAVARGHGRGEGFGHGRGMFAPLAMLFGLANGLIKLAALGMLAWLLLTLYQQRRTPPAAPAPTTPAGHDPRVE